MIRIPGHPRGAALAGAMLVVAILASATPAAAHDQLLESSPAEGESLTVAPEEVTLRFAAELLDLGAAVLVVDEDGSSWTDGEAVVAGTTVTAAVLDAMPDGRYELRWRVVSRDGHPISGIMPFTIGSVAGTPPPEPGATTATAPGQAAGPGEPGTTGGTDPLAPGSPVRIVLAGIVGAAVAAGGYALLLLGLRRRGTPPRGDGTAAP